MILPNNTYVKASEVFWGEHPFGRYRHQLSAELRRFSDLFARLGVRGAPDHNDAFHVLKEIANQFGTVNLPLDDPSYSVLIACWEEIELALTQEKTDAEALHAMTTAKVVPDARRVLNIPEHIFFEGRPGLAAKFKGNIENNVIPRPDGAWRAMEAAGVRTLAAAVRSHLLEYSDPVDDELVTSRVRQRRVQLERVLKAQDSEQSSSDLSVLDQLVFQAVNDLTIQYSLQAFNRDLASEPEPVSAHFHRDANVLHFVRRDDAPPWDLIACELALAETDQAAQAILDRLRIPSLDIPAMDAAEQTVVQDLGGETVPAGQAWTEPPKPASEAAPPVAQPGAGVPSEATSSQTEPPQGESMTADQAVDRILGADSGAPAPMSDELNKILPDEIARGRPGPRGTGGRREEDAGQERRKRYRGGSKLRTYVAPETEDDGEPDSELAAERHRVNQAGVERVAEHERRCGRLPEVMPQ